MHYQIIIYHIFRLCNTLVFNHSKSITIILCNKRKRGEMILPEYGKKEELCCFYTLITSSLYICGNPLKFSSFPSSFASCKSTITLCFGSRITAAAVFETSYLTGSAIFHNRGLYFISAERAFYIHSCVFVIEL